MNQIFIVKLMGKEQILTKVILGNKIEIFIYALKNEYNVTIYKKSKIHLLHRILSS